MSRLHSLAGTLTVTALSLASPLFAQTAPAPVTAVQAAPAPKAQATGSYLKIEGIAGESLDAAHAGWIDVQSFRWATARGGAASARTVARQVQSTISSMVVTKRLDKASPALQKASVEGQHFKTVVLEFVSQTKGEYYQITMSDVIVSGVRLSGAGDVPAESVTLNFAKFEAKYGKVDAQGNRAALQAVPAGWDVRLVTPPS